MKKLFVTFAIEESELPMQAADMDLEDVVHHLHEGTYLNPDWYEDHLVGYNVVEYGLV